MAVEDLVGGGKEEGGEIAILRRHDGTRAAYDGGGSKQEREQTHANVGAAGDGDGCLPARIGGDA